ncbi:SDA1-domain-containing protein [Endogone sp. FLAS-F59071]|nr:SDA1-domain-containing protein [Endogone sp. FLAS-F59071]|eukprot:RUS20386.1 SDA1-domain-containing protein [Endogone sp. FLAS-F59071]
MGKRNRAALLPTNIPQLQNLIKRDPTSYKDEFIQQLRHYQASLAIFKLKPDEQATEFGDLITFISQIAYCYPKETETFPQEIIDLLSDHYQDLHPDLRKCMVTALMLLRNKEVLDNTRLLPLFFTLFRCRDKSLRQLLYTHIVNDIRNANAKHKNNKLNKTLQSFMFTMLESAKAGNSDENAIAAKRSVDVCVELYRKNVWNDAKTVNVIAEACFSPVTKISVTGIQFFLGKNEDAEDEDKEKDNAPDLRKLQNANLHVRKTKARARKYETALIKVQKKERQKGKAENFNFSALHLLNDPQGFTEKLFSKLSSKDDRWEVRLMTMNLVSRIVGVHRLILLGFYSFLIKYLQPHQRDVTMVLVCAAQATHELVPPDALEPIIKAIANNFVTEHCASEVMAAGINGIREICSRQPLVMDATLLQDLTAYKSHRDKGVMFAARSLISLFRESNPELLLRRDRGKAVSMGMRDFRLRGFGEVDVVGAEGIRGIEALEEAEDGEDGEDGWANWEVEEGSGDESEDGWIDVSSDEGDGGVNVKWSDDDDSDSEEEGGKKGRKRKGKGKEKEEDAKDTDGDVDMTEEEKKEKDEEKERKKEVARRVVTTRILTPADFAKMNEARVHEKAEELIGKNKRKEESNPDVVDVGAIIGPRKKAKQDYEERMAHVREGREGRGKFGSRKGGERGSTTNREKEKNKNFMMVVHKQSVQSKRKISLRDKQIQLRAHIKKQKMRKH